MTHVRDDAHWHHVFMSDSPDRLHASFQNAFNHHDLDAIVALYEPDAVYTAGGQPVQGIDAIREVYRDVLVIGPTIELQTLSVTRAGNLALLHGKWSLRATGGDGSQISREGRNSELARLQPDGRWLFVIDNPSVPQD